MMALTQLSDFYLKSLQMHRWPVASAWGHSLGPTLTYNENDSKTNGLKCLLGSGASYPRESRLPLALSCFINFNTQKCFLILAWSLPDFVYVPRWLLQVAIAIREQVPDTGQISDLVNARYFPSATHLHASF